MTDPLLIAGLGAGTLAAVGLWSVVSADLPRVTRELRFPADLASDQVEALIRQVAASASGPVSITVDASQEGTRFLVSAPAPVLPALAGAWAGIAPTARLDEADIPEVAFTAASRLRVLGQWPVLRSDAADMAAAVLLSAVQPLGRGERLRIVVRLWPRRGTRRLPSELPGVPAEHGLHVKAKFSGEPLLDAEIVVGAKSGALPRARQLVHRVTTSLRARQGVRGHVRVSRATGDRAQSWMTTPIRRWFIDTRTIVSATEAAGLVGLPISGPAVAGVSYGVGPRLMPPAGLPTRGRVWASSTWPGSLDRPLAQPIVGALQHSLVVGPTGSGKSTLLLGLIRQALDARRGVVVLDVKGDLAGDVLAQVPANRRDDVIILDPASGLPQPGLKVFSRSADPDLTADLILGTLRELWPDSWGIRTSAYLRLGLRTLARAPGSTLLELPLLFSDGGRRRRALARINDPLLLASWARFEALSAADQAAQLAPALTKLEELLMRPVVRQVVGQAAPKLVFSEVLARGRVIVVRLPAGLIGSPASRLLATLTLWQFFSAVEARAALPADKRRTFEMYLDEVGALGALPLPLEALLERARGLGVAVTLAPQTLSQMPPTLRDAVLGNVGTIAAFRQTSAKEAHAVAAELPGVSADQLQALERFEIALRLSLGPGATTSVMTGVTAPTPAPVTDAAELSRYASARWGVPLSEVDAAFAEALGGETAAASGNSDSGPTGQRRRSA